MLFSNQPAPKQCEVAGCGVRRDATFAGAPPCRQGWGAPPEVIARALEKCLLRAAKSGEPKGVA